MAATGSNVTVDETVTNDNGYLRNARRYLTTVYGHVHTHGTTAMAVNNLSGGQDVHIVGHGTSGVVFTGGGLSTNDPTKFMGTTKDSMDDWQAILEHTNFESIRLWSCFTADNNAGRNFLAALVDTSGARCFALTGSLVCHAENGFILDDAQWFEVGPGGVPDAVPTRRVPVPHASLPFILFRDGAATVLRRDHVHLTSFGAAPPVSAFTDALDVHSVPIEQGLSVVDWTNPLMLGGAPCGIRTGQLRVGFLGHTGSEYRLFDVYNNALVWDREHGVYYRCTSLFDSLPA